MRPTNLLFILSDQHTRSGLGCYGGPGITPHLDALARRGTRFDAAYTNCPICVPERASLATGRYVHEIGFWDNGIPYDGSVPSWGHHLRGEGFSVDSIGKLHFRSSDDDNGFSREIEPLHVVDGLGDLLSCVRDDPPRRNARRGVQGAGPGDSTYLTYDIRNADNAIAWLREQAGAPKPWVLFLSFVCPHPPYIGPESWYRRYRELAGDVPLPPQWQPEQWPRNPALAHFRHFFHQDEPFTEEELRNLNAAYYAACSHLDEQIGRVLGALGELGLTGDTRVIYSTDHGESAGARGLTGKFTMYDESAGVPLIVAGPDVPEGRAVATPVSLVDCYPTVVSAVGGTAAPGLPGDDLWQLAAGPDQDRTVFSEYHAIGSPAPPHPLPDARYKYVYYVGGPPQLFDLAADPEECRDLAEAPDPATAAVLARFEDRLRALLDPEAVDRRAKADQAARVAAHGGREAVLARGTFANSPTPDDKPTWAYPGA